MASPVDPTDGYAGLLQTDGMFAQYGALSFMISQMLGKSAGATVVRVVSCSNAGGVAPVGTVDVQPLVNQVDGADRSTPHGIIHQIPYMRLQGGASAVIIDPQPGDIGIAVFADRDISNVKSTRKLANPGSKRRNSMADGLYIGGVLNGTPTQLVAFTASGVTITAPTVTINAPSVQINGTVTVSGDLTAAGTNVHTHRHTGVQTGGGISGPPS